MPTYNGVEVADTAPVYRLADDSKQEELDAHPRDLADQLDRDEYVESVLCWKGQVSPEYFHADLAYQEAVEELDALVDEDLATVEEEPEPPTNAVYVFDGDAERKPPHRQDVKEMDVDTAANTLLESQGNVTPDYLAEVTGVLLSDAIDYLEARRDDGDVVREEKPMR